MMKNKWKAAFWIQSIMYVATTLFLLYLILDQSVTLTYMRESYEDTENDLEQISDVIEGKLNKSDFNEMIERQAEAFDGKEIHLNRIRITFGKDNKVDSITTQW